MLSKKIFAGIALVTSVSLITPMSAPFVPANSVAMAMETELSQSGSLPCENGENIQYTFENGVLTLSGKGDKLADYFVFNGNDSITKVVFTDNCTLENIDYMFDGCKNLSVIENIPDTVISMANTLSRTALTEIPELPAHIQDLDYTFSGCTGITEVDFSKLPSSIQSFDGAFENTSVTNVTIAFPESKETSLSFAYCFSDCSQLKTMVVDATNTNINYGLWLQGICDGCSVLESFELKNIPANHNYPGAYCASSMFKDCENLVSVKNEGYFYFSGNEIFENCSKLKNIESKGFVELYPDASLKQAFMGCESLEGTYYIQLASNSQIYKGFYENKNLDDIKEYLNDTFKGCSDKATFYINCKPLVDYYNELKTMDEYAFDATILYWEEKDFYEHPDYENPTVTDDPTTETPDITQSPVDTYAPENTQTPMDTNSPTNTTSSAISTNAPTNTTSSAISTDVPSNTTSSAISTNAPTNTTSSGISTNAPTNTKVPWTNTNNTQTTPSNTNTPNNTPTTPSNTNAPTTPNTQISTTKKKNIATLKLSKYKKGTKKITGKTIKNAKVVVTVNGKSYSVKSNKKGTFTVKLKTKLKAKAKIKVTVSKSGYQKKTKTFKVK